MYFVINEPDKVKKSSAGFIQRIEKLNFSIILALRIIFYSGNQCMPMQNLKLLHNSPNIGILDTQLKTEKGLG